MIEASITFIAILTACALCYWLGFKDGRGMNSPRR